MKSNKHVAENEANGSGRFEKMEKKMQKSFLDEIVSKLGKKIEDSLGEEGMRKAGKVVDLVNNYFYELGQSEKQKILEFLIIFIFRIARWRMDCAKIPRSGKC